MGGWRLAAVDAAWLRWVVDWCWLLVVGCWTVVRCCERSATRGGRGRREEEARRLFFFMNSCHPARRLGNQK